MKLYNTLTKQKEEFVPVEEGKVGIYVCGPTVYNYIHIGNARPICVCDVLRRFLEYIGFKIKLVQNFTDIDDKIINLLVERFKIIEDVSELKKNNNIEVIQESRISEIIEKAKNKA